MSTRSELSPVRLFLGMTYGSTLKGSRSNLRPDGSALEGGDRLGLGVEQGDVVLVDVDPDVQAVAVADHDKGLVPHRRGELAGADVHLQDLAVGEGADDQAFEHDLGAF